MIELNTEYGSRGAPNPPRETCRDHLLFSFGDVHPQAWFNLEFQRTLRIPDDDSDYPLPPGLGCFPLRHIDDFADRVPAPWREHGGVMLPLYQSEAMWINFVCQTGYPFLVKIAAGKINAITGTQWENAPNQDPQDYVALPEQPWLDGFCVEKGVIRQFVAAPLGAGYSVEEQITGQAEYGGLQIIAYPMKAAAWEKLNRRKSRDRICEPDLSFCKSTMALDMGLAPGGRMKQAVLEDPHDFSVWDLDHSSRCFIHLTNSLSWAAVTGDAPPTLPPTAAHYAKLGLPWFEYYSETASVDGSNILNSVKPVAAMDTEKPAGAGLLPENESTGKVQIIRLGDKSGIVREF